MRGPIFSTLLSSALVFAVFLGGADAATITLNTGTKYQVVDGFGSHNNLTAWKVRQGPFYITVDLGEVGFWDSLAQDMQIMRMAIPQFQASQGAPYGTVNFSHAVEMANRGMTKFFGSCWSPPGWMKSNGQVTQGGTLLPQYYDDFSDLLAEYTRQFKAATGLDMYAISLQNEPLWSQPYSSCQYNTSTYRDLLKVAGPILEAASPNTKILGAEDVLPSASRCNGWVNAILSDAGSRPYFDIYAVHCHTQIFDDPTDSYNGWWNTVQSVADPNGFPLWMTEVGDNFDTTWNTAVRLCATICNSFKYGNCAAWVWWILARDTDINAMVLNGRYTGKYYQMAHFGRFVKPGAQRIESSVTGGALREVGFQNTDGSVVAVVINKQNSADNVILSGPGLPGEFRAHQSTRNVMMQDMGIVTTGNSLALPAQSMTTLTSNTATAAQMREAAAKRLAPKSVCRQALNGAAVAVKLSAPSSVSLSVYTPRGELLASTEAVSGAGELTLRWHSPTRAHPVATGMYVGRVRIEQLDAGKTTEHVLSLRPR